jgi:hypothetical protein
MNPLSNVITAKARRMLLVAALVLCPFLAFQSGNAQPAPVVTATLTNNGSSAINIMQGGTFTLTLQISTNFASSGITYFLRSDNGSGFFRITARDMSMNPYPDPTTDDMTAFGGDAGLLNPVNDFDLGSTNNGSATDAPGFYTIATLTLTLVNPLPPGQYTIFIDRGVVTDRTGGGFEDRAFTAMATITIPEPATVCFAVIGGLLLIGATWRRKS